MTGDLTLSELVSPASPSRPLSPSLFSSQPTPVPGREGELNLSWLAAVL